VFLKIKNQQLIEKSRSVSNSSPANIRIFQAPRALPAGRSNCQPGELVSISILKPKTGVFFANSPFLLISAACIIGE
jgi:hypothetical protein